MERRASKSASNKGGGKKSTGCGVSAGWVRSADRVGRNGRKREDGEGAGLWQEEGEGRGGVEGGADVRRGGKGADGEDKHALAGGGDTADAAGLNGGDAPGCGA
jgi:hypothetical protein